MSDTNTNNQTATTEQLTAQLAAIRSGFAKSLGLEDSATDEAMLARAAELVKERDDSRAQATAMTIDAALRDAFAKSGATMGHYEDFHNLAASQFHVDPASGKVISKPDASTPNVDPATWCVVELRQRRSGWFPLSQGGGVSSRGAGLDLHRGPSDECFRPGPTFNFTKQLAFEHAHGAAAADAARRRYGGGR